MFLFLSASSRAGGAVPVRGHPGGHGRARRHAHLGCPTAAQSGPAASVRKGQNEAGGGAGQPVLDRQREKKKDGGRLRCTLTRGYSPPLMKGRGEGPAQ